MLISSPTTTTAPTTTTPAPTTTTPAPTTRPPTPAPTTTTTAPTTTTTAPTTTTPAPTTPTVNGCPEGWSQYDDYCYNLYTTSVTYMEARQFCRDQGGFLASIVTWKINSWINSFVPDTCAEFWIGGARVTNDDAFKWDDGRSFAYENFDGNFPRYNNNYISFIHNRVFGNVGKWRTITNEYKKPYLCHKKRQTVTTAPVPSTTTKAITKTPAPSTTTEAPTPAPAPTDTTTAPPADSPTSAPTTTKTPTTTTSAPTTTTTAPTTTTPAPTTTTAAPTTEAPTNSPTPPGLNCWTCPPGYQHWWELGLSQPSDRCACILIMPPATTSTPLSDDRGCWYCPKDWSHWYDLGLSTQTNGDRCQCIYVGRKSILATTPAPAQLDENGCMVCEVGWLHWYELGLTAPTNQDKCQCIKSSV
ncbi:hypothetical protein AKO1_006933 [Acrasis kona]|uniref:C-type lectin domain-containing protein n=1 Tax=Acrasis kona TaxID=1008807 RepID=A0AAW2YUS6_9EUKA